MGFSRRPAAYRAAFGEEPTGDWAAAAYACAQVIIASLEAVADDGPDAEGLREAVRARAVDTSKRYETAIGTVGFDENGDSIKQMVSFFRVDPEAADCAGDWAHGVYVVNADGSGRQNLTRTPRSESRPVGRPRRGSTKRARRK
ncbi:MAG TPA: hypothetical protein VLA69_05070 [Gaiellaceae bacterium]|nr:hypothetical protein [Gaiellaceae bacterium]